MIKRRNHKLRKAIKQVNVNRLLTFLGLPAMALAAAAHRFEAELSWWVAGSMLFYVWLTVSAMYYVAQPRSLSPS
jgi:hypothetical protein